MALALTACPSSDHSRTLEDCVDGTCECVFTAECPTPLLCVDGQCKVSVGGDTSSSDADVSGEVVDSSGQTDASDADVGDGADGADSTADGADGSDTITPGGLGAPCFTNTECTSGYCIDSADGGYCTRQCEDSCEDQYRCVQTIDRADPISLCVHDENRLCRPCIDDASCGAAGTDLCLDIGGGRFCSRDCTHEVCPTGFTCSDVKPPVGETRRQCLPDNGTCDCTNATTGLVKACTAENASGTCFGLATCDPARGFVDCSARSPEAEVCNGKDDDCDGATDEEQQSTACTIENDLGSCSGQETCQGPLGRVCSARTPAAEACNGVDDDCDGATDEDFQTDGVFSGAENCGACGHDCNAQFQHSLEVACDVSGDAPTCVLTSCEPGYILFGGSACIDENATLCTPCDADADCYGTGSRCLQVSDTDPRTFCARDCSGTSETTATCPASYACEPVAGGTDQCRPVTDSCDCTATNQGQTKACTRSNAIGTCFGLETCDAATGWNGCTAATPSAEVCNGQDDDCDGQVDDGVAVGATCASTNTAGSCSGTTFCAGELGIQCSARIPADDVCNGQDDDCDGQTDEDFATTTGGALKYDKSTANCGACNYACPPVAHGSVVCDGSGATPRCAVGDCDEGYYALGGVACVPVPRANSCAPCTSDADCAGPADRCVDDGQGKLRCARDCGAGAVYDTAAQPCTGEDGAQGCCPDDYQCTAFGADRLCRPTSGTCDCIEDGATLACQATNAFGTCNGVRVCELDGAPGLGACSARTPAAEVCNNEDDDCDGQVDGLDTSLDFTTTPNGQTSCGDGPGCPGSWSCVGGAWECSARPASAEVCDSADNDCDGQTDETFRDAQGRYVSSANCGACGLDCLQLVANATAVECALVSGAPTCRATACAPGTYAFDGGRACLALPDNLCQACTADADCLVPGSRCLGSGAERFCGRSCASGSPYGTSCPTGYQCADQGGGDRQCAPVSGTCVCGPGAVGLERACPVGACTGLQECQQNGANYAFSACSAEGIIPEVCDGGDNDCDGTTDEGFRHGAVYDTDHACGGCGNDCTLRWSAEQHANGACNTTGSPHCVIASCKTEVVAGSTFEWVDTNAAPGDGCECRRAQGNLTVDDPDEAFGNSYPTAGASYVDQNCDGVDGVVGDALFVSAANTAAGNGTRANPYKTIGAAVAAFTASGKKYILVAGGDYRENVNLVSGVKLHGGYSGDFSRRDIATFETRILGVEPAFGVGSVLPGTIYAANLRTGRTLVSGFVIRGYDVTTAPAASASGYQLRHLHGGHDQRLRGAQQPHRRRPRRPGRRRHERRQRLRPHPERRHRPRRPRRHERRRRPGLPDRPLPGRHLARRRRGRRQRAVHRRQRHRRRQRGLPGLRRRQLDPAGQRQGRRGGLPLDARLGHQRRQLQQPPHRGRLSDQHQEARRPRRRAGRGRQRGSAGPRLRRQRRQLVGRPVAERAGRARRQRRLRRARRRGRPVGRRGHGGRGLDAGRRRSGRHGALSPRCLGRRRERRRLLGGGGGGSGGASIGVYVTFVSFTPTTLQYSRQHRRARARRRRRLGRLRRPRRHAGQRRPRRRQPGLLGRLPRRQRRPRRLRRRGRRRRRRLRRRQLRHRGVAAAELGRGRLRRHQRLRAGRVDHHRRRRRPGRSVGPDAARGQGRGRPDQEPPIGAEAVDAPVARGRPSRIVAGAVKARASARRLRAGAGGEPPHFYYPMLGARVARPALPPAALRFVSVQSGARARRAPSIARFQPCRPGRAGSWCAPMRAARIHSYGGPEVFSVDDDAPDPVAGPGQVLVQVHASSVNPVDCKIRNGAFRAALRYPLPRTLGMDVSGVVVGVGEGVARWKVGDEVVGSPGPKTPGTYAELTVLPEGELGRKPKNLSHVEAASLPLAFLTAWQALVDKSHLKAGERLLVQAGAGGVGSLAIQIGKHLGAYVATTCSARNTELVKSLGADRAIDYNAEQWDAGGKDFDVVLDALGLAEARKARKILKKGGRIVGISVGLPERVKKAGPVLGILGTGVALGCTIVGSRLRGVPSRFFTRKADGGQLDTMAELCESGALKPVIDSVYPLAQIAEAHRHSDSGRARGKIVIQVRPA
ncbi:MAG: NADP-dependent oxidoreductase [Myxococcota bacterium]